MNKAFVRESDDLGERCPRCNSPGVPVFPETLRAHLSAAQLEGLTASAFFCPFERCDVVYFDLFERTVEQSQLAAPVYPKNPAAPICACFGFCVEEIDEDIRAGGVARTRAAVERARSPEAQCAVKSPAGQSCVAEIQRYYMQHRGS
jgi:hypothetical protein